MLIASSRIAVQPVAGVGRMATRIGYRHALERVREPHCPACYLIRCEHRAHHDRRAAAPHPGLDQVAGDRVRQHGLDAPLEMIETARTDHRLADQWPGPSFAALAVVDPANQCELLRGQPPRNPDPRAQRLVHPADHTGVER